MYGLWYALQNICIFIIASREQVELIWLPWQQTIHRLNCFVYSPFFCITKNANHVLFPLQVKQLFFIRILFCCFNCICLYLSWNHRNIYRYMPNKRPRGLKSDPTCSTKKGLYPKWNSYDYV